MSQGDTAYIRRTITRRGKRLRQRVQTFLIPVRLIQPVRHAAWLAQFPHGGCRCFYACELEAFR